MEAFDAGNTKRTLGARRLKGKVEELELADSFQASQSVCGLLSAGVIALYGPQSYESTSHVQSMSASMGVPHLEARVDFKPPGNHSVNLMPSPYVLARAFRDLATHNKSPSYAIVYGSDDALPRIQEFLKDENLRRKAVIARRTTGVNNKEILDEIKSKGIRNIILDLSVRDPNFGKFMKAAQEHGMLREYYNYIATSLDLERAEIPPVDASILSFSLIPDPGTTYSVATALTHDAVQLLTESLAELLKTKPLERHNLACGLHESWPYGLEIRNQLLKTKIQGKTGEVKFDENGIRSDVKLRLLENVGDNGAFKTIGSWTPSEGLRLNEDHASEEEAKHLKSLKNQNLVILVTPPDNKTEYSIDGYLNELLSVVQAELGFKATTRQVSTYGSRGSDGKWTGLVGELVQGTADVVLADLTITPDREEVIDFTIPFYTGGLAVLIKKSDVGNMTSPEDLVNQDAITVGALKFGSTRESLKTSNDLTQNKLWKKMDSSCPSSFTLSRRGSIDKVKAGGFAFITESLTVEQVINNSCDLQTLGDPFGKIRYGFGMRKDSPYTSIFSNVLNKLQSSGKLQELKDKHFRKNTELECYKKP